MSYIVKLTEYDICTDIFPKECEGKAVEFLNKGVADFYNVRFSDFHRVTETMWVSTISDTEIKLFNKIFILTASACPSEDFLKRYSVITRPNGDCQCEVHDTETPPSYIDCIMATVNKYKYPDYASKFYYLLNQID